MTVKDMAFIRGSEFNFVFLVCHSSVGLGRSPLAVWYRGRQRPPVSNIVMRMNKTEHDPDTISNEQTGPSTLGPTGIQIARQCTQFNTSASVELTQTRHSHSKQLFHGGQISVFLQGGSKSFIRCL